MQQNQMDSSTFDQRWCFHNILNNQEYEANDILTLPCRSWMQILSRSRHGWLVFMGVTLSVLWQTDKISAHHLNEMKTGKTFQD
jgi:hypothetical protein